MTLEMSRLLSEMICGAVAAAGFGVVFNVSWRQLPWCALSGALALGVRWGSHEWGATLEGASFAAALFLSAAVRIPGVRPELALGSFDAIGCLPMVPGSFAAKAILGLFAITTGTLDSNSENLNLAMQYTLRAAFTLGALGTGLAIPALLIPSRRGRSGHTA